MDFDDFVRSAWADHGERPEWVAERLAASVHQVTEAARVAPFAGLVAHVFGAHLGRWQRATELLRALPRHGAGTDRAIALDCAALRHMDGDAAALSDLAGEDRIVVLAKIAALASGHGQFEVAIGAYRDALALAGGGLPDGSPALRALAVGGNNLAAALEEKPDRTTFETQGMLDAAEGGLTYWPRAGSWLEHERAAYRLACSRLQAGLPAQAAQAARLCLSVCDAHDAPPFERFFGQAALAMACRANDDQPAFEIARDAALALHAALGADDRVWCADELRALGGTTT